MIKGLR